MLTLGACCCCGHVGGCHLGAAGVTGRRSQEHERSFQARVVTASLRRKDRDSGFTSLLLPRAPLSWPVPSGAVEAGLSLLLGGGGRVGLEAGSKATSEVKVKVEVEAALPRDGGPALGQSPLRGVRLPPTPAARAQSVRMPGVISLRTVTALLPAGLAALASAPALLHRPRGFCQSCRDSTPEGSKALCIFFCSVNFSSKLSWVMSHT